MRTGTKQSLIFTRNGSICAGLSTSANPGPALVKSGGTGGANPFAVLASSEAGFRQPGPRSSCHAVAALGGPLVLAALALVLIFFQDLNGTDVGPLCREWGNRRILFRNRHCICRSGVSARETLLWEYRSLCTRLHRNAFFDIFGTYFQFASGAAGRASRVGITLCQSGPTGAGGDYKKRARVTAETKMR